MIVIVIVMVVLSSVCRYEVMEILLSRLQDEPESQPNFERIAGRCCS